MTRRFILRPRAENDIRSAFEWYESRRPRLGEQFLTAVRDRLESIREFPDANPIVYRDIRRAVVSRYPYLVSYILRPPQITVLAVLHHARNPAIWPRR